MHVPRVNFSNDEEVSWKIKLNYFTRCFFVVPYVCDTSLPLPAGDEGGGGGVDAVLHHAQVRRQLTTAVAGQTLAWKEI